MANRKDSTPKAKPRPRKTGSRTSDPVAETDADEVDDAADIGPKPTTARTYRTAIAVAYTRALDRGLELELDELHAELDWARAVERSLRSGELARWRAILAGYEHAQVKRMGGRMPATFVV